MLKRQAPLPPIGAGQRPVSSKYTTSENRPVPTDHPTREVRRRRHWLLDSYLNFIQNK